MGVHPAIDFFRFPRQGDWVGKRVTVCFNYDTEFTLQGTVVRDDREPPHTCPIQLDDGRFVNATECQHTSPE